MKKPRWCCWCRESVLADEGEQFPLLFFFFLLSVTSPHEMWSIKTENEKKATIHQESPRAIYFFLVGLLGCCKFVVDENKRRDHVRVVANERFHGHQTESSLRNKTTYSSPVDSSGQRWIAGWEKSLFDISHRAAETKSLHFLFSLYFF